ncbi:MAG: acyl carrier protein [Moorea sp. SIO1F2]|uniref:acyl carrier protein n=1 Tax=unclassified Moorena TaxID=2683338 RepID=UPI0013BD1C0F|nr:MULTISPECIES: acyl carrier protein [unclassified Moorena]NEO04183.1 acyl carrier protein [Moorena sp. SIO3I8]NEO21803.1 acyl carrier protein [Moorena sp. SIO4A5]NEQ57916.1 acyl carrier protein [Moorena sp. SIO4A1]NET81452.1 acyl carrier protein [Moorena sp. SIO1F2]
MSTIEEVVYAAIRKVKPSLLETELSLATRFDDYRITSMEMAMIVFEIEDHYDIEIEAHTLIDFDTIGAACEFIAKLLAKKNLQGVAT